MSKLPKYLVEKMISFDIWNDTCPVHHSRLRLLEVEYMSFGGDVKDDGRIIVLDVIADNVHKIFQELREVGFPLCQIKTIDEFGGNDELSMEENNSSAFNCRRIKNSSLFSIHAYGLAIDINPVQNPYISSLSGELVIEPKKGRDYADRSKNSPGMINEEIVGIFRKNQIFGWGGSWQSIKDWHHFEVPRDCADRIVGMSYKQGKKYLDNLSFS